MRERDAEPDVACLDIQMPCLACISVVRRLDRVVIEAVVCALTVIVHVEGSAANRDRYAGLVLFAAFAAQ